MSVTRLMILGLLRERPFHGYEIKKTMKERHMDEWTDIAFGSIYFALRRLTQEGFAHTQGIEQDGNRPSRTVYAITGAGDREFFRLLRENWQSDSVDREVLRSCIIFMQELQPGEVQRYLRAKANILDGIIRHIDEVYADVAAHGAPWTARHVCSYDAEVCTRSRDWLSALANEIEKCSITWTVPQ